AKAFKDLAWRPIGPANMGGRVSAIAVVEKHPATFYVGLGTGGVFKTGNAGTTWSAVFEKEAVASIGAIAVWQKNPDVVWVGTGEANSRNSSSWGNGVYRSTDGGGTWTSLGLPTTQAIARVVLDPADSNVAYVAALGHLWGENPERGVFVTRDGGKTWSQTLKVDAATGACDLAMDPSDAHVLYAAMYARKRTPWSFTAGGRTGGIWKSSDAGRTWTRLTEGLPAETGRIGLDVYRKNPRVVYAVVESDLGGQFGAFDPRSRSGGVFRSDDAGAHWTRLSAWTPRPFYFGQIRVQPDDDRRVYLLGVDIWVSDDGGRTFRPGGAKNLHPDFHAMWINPADGDHVVAGCDGGVNVSHDRAATWDFIDNLAAGEVYDIAVDMREPYRVYAGLQDNQTWGGPSATRIDPEAWLDDKKHDGITNASWYCLGGGDGFHVAVDPTDPDLVYYESQGGTLQRVNLATGRERVLKPGAREGEPEYRFNWNTPFMLSPHDPSVLWMGGNCLFRFSDRGDRWTRVSPDLSTADPKKMVTAGSGAETHCTIVSLAESPVARGVVWAGTDDGKVWVTPDGGGHWNDLTANLRGVPPGLYVSRIEASHHDAATAYVALDGHRGDLFRPFLLATHDMGKSWASIAGDLPANGPVQVIREDPTNRALLFAGTEFGLFASFDAGAHWIRLGDGLPTVAVDDILVHPRDHDLIAGTHGRSVFVLDDITALEQWKAEDAAAPATLFAPRPATAFYYRTASVFGQRGFSARNPAFGAYFTYYVKEWTGDGVDIAVADSAGKTVRKLSGPGTPGFHRVVWDLTGEAKERLARGEWGDQPQFVPAGRYTVKLTYGKQAEKKTTVDVRYAAGVETPGP
ncbi:MAG: hypothetical protein HY076_04340, partial [Candidatus Eisenbacteria bacterium]|nr:hypothetical protein [Candidatus Eisenbacteria bacterium]